MVGARDAIRILERLSAAGIPIWLTGGWGIDSLLGAETRPHKDLDLLLRLADVARMRQVLAGEGYELKELWPENRWVPGPAGAETPTAFVLEDAAGRQVDAHAMRVDQAGNGVPAWGNPEGLLFRQEDLAGEGAIAGYPVRCITPTMQLLCHAGYELPAGQVRDLELLRRRFCAAAPWEPPAGPPGRGDPEGESLCQILARHAGRYPGLQVQDLYKLLHQAACGSEHAAADGPAARAWLEQEVAGLGEGPEEPIVEPISADGQVVRVHLRPYVAAGGDLDLLAAAFARTSREHRGCAVRLRRYWRYAERMAQEGALGLPAEELQCFFQEMEARGFPAVHHSPEYTRAYRPAYRVVRQEYLAGG